VRESIKTTTVKPSGSVSILAGSTPGVHWAPGGKTYLRAIRFGSEDPMVPLFVAAGYLVEDDVVSANTKVVYFPVKTTQKRSEKDVSIFEKVHLASLAQRHWSDNAVSVTVSFDREAEGRHVGTVLHMYEGQLKTVSFLPSSNTVYPQMPYTSITQEEYDSYVGRLARVDFSAVYNGLTMGLDAAGERYCTTDVCELKVTPAAAEFEDEAEQSSLNK
jgi:ribonucleoside-triphosphate reductase